MVHHGGAGTCHQALRAGVPQLVTPIFGDQPDNARRLEALGVARSVPLRRFAPDTAVEALTPLLRPEVARRAAELAPVAAAERGAERAADILERAAGAREAPGRG